jgi:hypothetical protein
MYSDKPTLSINNIPGIAIKRTDEAVGVYFLKSLTFNEWKEIEGYLDQLLKTGAMHFVFHLQRLNQFTSVDIGMWVTLNTKIKAFFGKLEFVLGHNSTAQKYMNLAQLDKIFSITTNDPDQDTLGDPCA